MSKFIALTKIQLKDFFSKYEASLNIKNRLLSRLLTLLVVFSLGVLPVQLTITLYDSFSAIGMPELTITYIYVMVAFFMLVTAIPLIVSMFFHSKDMTFLSSLPVKEYQIIFSKLSSIYVYLLGLSAFMLGPSLIIYGIRDGLGFVGVPLAILALFVSPLLPLMIATLVIIPTMSLVSGTRNRNLFSILSGFAMLTIILVFQTTIVRQQTDPEFIQRMLTQEDGLMRFLGMRFPPSIWFTKMVTGSIIDGIYFIGLSLLMAGILAGLSSLVYNKAMQAFNQDTTVGSGKIYYRVQSKGLQLIRRHILIILKQPTFFLNTFLSMLVPILMYFITMFTGEFNTQMLENPMILPYITLIFAINISMPAIIANLSATAITREGKTFWETKVLPISAEDNLKYRIWTTIIINLFGSVLLGIFAALILPLSIKSVALGALVCITLTLFLATADIIINIYRPLLDWTHPTAAVKNNLNIMISIAFRGILAGPIYLVYRFAPGIDFDVLLIGLSAFFLLGYFISRFVVFKKMPQKFSDIAI